MKQIKTLPASYHFNIKEDTPTIFYYDTEQLTCSWIKSIPINSYQVCEYNWRYNQNKMIIIKLYSSTPPLDVAGVAFGGG